MQRFGLLRQSKASRGVKASVGTKAKSCSPPAPAHGRGKFSFSGSPTGRPVGCSPSHVHVHVRYVIFGSLWLSVRCKNCSHPWPLANGAAVDVSGIKQYSRHDNLGERKAFLSLLFIFSITPYFFCEWMIIIPCLCSRKSLHTLNASYTHWPWWRRSHRVYSIPRCCSCFSVWACVFLLLRLVPLCSGVCDTILWHLLGGFVPNTIIVQLDESMWKASICPRATIDDSR
jgi:hypothetical protein